jgi:thiol-disulfide isomerase/thioredoxin
MQVHALLLATAFALGTGASPHTPFLGLPRLHKHVIQAGKQVSPLELDAELAAWTTPVLLDFFAPWCSPCKLMAQELSQVGHALEGRCRILSVDVEQHSRLAEAFAVDTYPTVLLLAPDEQGRPDVLRKLEGALPAETILQEIEYHFFSGPPPEFPNYALLHGGAS